MKKVVVIGLGPGDVGQIGLEAFNRMKKAKKLFFRTQIHPCIDYIREQDIKIDSFDYLYEEEDDFDELYKKISQEIIKASNDYEEVVYAVPGHPLVAEKTVQLLLENNDDVNIEIISAMSFVDAIFTSLKIDPIKGIKIIDGLSLKEQKPDPDCGNIITQVFNKIIAADVKLELMETYNDEQEITVIRAAGVKGEEKISNIMLYELDRLDYIDYLTSIYIPAVSKEMKKQKLNDLIDIMEVLRSEHGCDWDKKQTTKTLIPYLIEETYEVVNAINKNDKVELVDELGDLLLQIVFHAQIGKEQGEYDINDIIEAICNKLIERHPHVFAGQAVEAGEGGALASWEAAKRIKNSKSYTQSMKDIPNELPALMRSYKVQEKAALSGFDWENIEEAFAKIDEEIEELREVYLSKDREKIEDEMGDLIFSIVNVARFLKMQPELALTGTIEKFISRFNYVEESLIKAGKNVENTTLMDMDVLWNEAKKIGKKK